MRKHIAILAFAACGCLGIPAQADTVLYSDGPINGTINAELINAGKETSDSFTLTSGSTLTGVQDIGLWTVAGDAPVTVVWDIGTVPFGSTDGTGTATLTNNSTSIPGSGDGGVFTVWSSSFSLPSITLGSGTYYLTLEQGVTANSMNLGWDINNGPSSASHTGSGSVPAESFEIVGNVVAAVPEPRMNVVLSALLVGLLALARLRRRKAETQS
jgi:hypothetical protein